MVPEEQLLQCATQFTLGQHRIHEGGKAWPITIEFEPSGWYVRCQVAGHNNHYGLNDDGEWKYHRGTPCMSKEAALSMWNAWAKRMLGE